MIRPRNMATGKPWFTRILVARSGGRIRGTSFLRQSEWSRMPYWIWVLRCRRISVYSHKIQYSICSVISVHGEFVQWRYLSMLRVVSSRYSLWLMMRISVSSLSESKNNMTRLVEYSRPVGLWNASLSSTKRYVSLTKMQIRYISMISWRWVRISPVRQRWMPFRHRHRWMISPISSIRVVRQVIPRALFWPVVSMMPLWLLMISACQ